MLLSPPTGEGEYNRLQMDVSCSLDNGVVVPTVNLIGCDCVPTGTHVDRVLSFPILDPNISVGDLLELVISAGLDHATINANNAACGRFCFQTMKTFADHGLIRDDWALLAYQWHADIGIASGPLGATVIDEDIIHL
ncbi:hypothetical protein ARMGADRAFT_1091758 [Armillaria gallica]|uniref:Uncharacterized protein n=1 Tax=Armillaria gallica TaxID=47427 RepID=A0A2H3CR45_ARMGA|nr:hypothetical protein ARMGADRAFT_1091758 [Armillaria gallica]